MIVTDTKVSPSKNLKKKLTLYKTIRKRTKYIKQTLNLQLIKLYQDFKSNKRSRNKKLNRQHPTSINEALKRFVKNFLTQ